jgi:hypothetical protein
MTPKVREDRLLLQEVGDELVIYDQERKVIHSLNATAALVWRHCDGQTSISDIAALLYRETQLPANEEFVWFALARLGEARLLREPVTRPTDAVSLTRRQLIRKLGVTAGLALLPLVASITAPTPAMGASPRDGGTGDGGTGDGGTGGGFTERCTCKCQCSDEEEPLPGFFADGTKDCSSQCQRICAPAGARSDCAGIS